MKKYLIISFLTLVFSVTVALAATTDFVANGDITVSSVTHPNSGGTTADLTIVSGSRAESWSYDSGNFSVTNPDATNLFTVSASGVSSVRVNDSASQEVACGAGSVQLPSTAGLYRVYASGSSCAGSSSSGSSSGGSSGGGRTPAMPATPATPAVPAIPSVTPAVPAIPAWPALPHASPRAAFNRRLIAGSIGSDVKSLQQFLNSNGFVIVTTGPGSPGNETTIFGPATKRALIKYQIAQSIVQTATDDGAGELGPKTRTAINNSATTVMPVTPALIPENRQALINTLRLQLSQLMEQLRQMQARGQQ